MTGFLRNGLVSLSLVTALVIPGCLGTGGVRAGYTVTATTGQEPTLAYYGNGLWVAEDYGEPMFYSDGYYWAYRDGYWVRTPRWGHSWARVSYSYLPHTIRGIDRPSIYVRYRARPGIRVRNGVRGRVYVRARDVREERRERKNNARGDRRERKDGQHDRRHMRD